VKALAQLLNDMRSGGVIDDYALFGATAQMRYTEPVATLVADVLVAVPSSSEGLDVMSGIYEFCAGRARKLLSWPEKIRMVEGIRESARQLRAMRDEREEDRERTRIHRAGEIDASSNDHVVGDRRP